MGRHELVRIFREQHVADLLIRASIEMDEVRRREGEITGRKKGLT